MATRNSYAWDLIELGDITATHQRYFGNETDNMPVGSNPSTSYGLGVNFVILDNLFFNNTFQGITDQTNLRTFGWQYELGAKLTSYMDVGYARQNLNAIGVQQEPWQESEIFIRIRLHKGSEANPIW